MTGLLEVCWPAHARVRALQTTRAGGASDGCWASYNLGLHCGDDREAVLENRRRLEAILPAEPAWLRQVHGRNVVNWHEAKQGAQADAVISDQPGQVCAVLTADCLPVLLADENGREIAAIHAGWRGLAAGIIDRTVNSMSSSSETLMAWLGPAISRRYFQVGEEVRAAFLRLDPNSECAFYADGDRWKADLYELARQQLRAAGVDAIHGGNYCTFGEPDRFYSYRRDRQTGRMASLIWLDHG